ncbi:type VI secretion system tip protein TssI/VgrG [Niveibacterium sp. SC-1]|uniref:type VI secretion system Vgr family protein n=1 Tax=Niveibacterium sp. SC-1 TaxID=3135646 RepID=UPI00311DAE10
MFDSFSTALSELTTGLDSRTRLLDIDLQDGSDIGASLQVESFLATEGLSSLSRFDVFLLSPAPDLALADLIGRQARLSIRLADGSPSLRSGYVSQAERLGSDQALTRYRLRLVPWLWLATQRSDCRVFQEKSLRDIVEAVFAAYAPRAHWTWDAGCEEALGEMPLRSYCVQYRESDYDFLSRLLAEEGIGFCFAEREDQQEEALSTASAHTLRLFAASGALPEDPVSAAENGIRFHRADAAEQSDAVTQWQTQRRVVASATQLASWSYKSRTVLNGIEESPPERLGGKALDLQDYDTPGAYAFGNDASLSRQLRLLREAAEARSENVAAAGSLRSLRAGTRFALSNAPTAPWLDASAEEKTWLVLGLRALALNNLPHARNQDGALEALRDWLDRADVSKRAADGLPALDLDSLGASARTRGYAAVFAVQRAEVPWRPALEDGTGLRLNPRPTAPGAQSAIVVGADGAASPGPDGEVFTDALHRVRVRFHWQADGDGEQAPNTAWLRIASRVAGQGMGMQFVPRIGQEVLVGFLEGDIDRPIVLGGLYNGQGEGGQAPSPGDESGEADTAELFRQAADHRPAAQGNLVGGRSPAWHGEGGAHGGHRNRASLSGFKSAELGQGTNVPSTFNQLVFDDTDAQLRVQMASTRAASQLNLGHLVHQADNYRGSHRGDGFELRTDAYGAIRAARGLLFTTWPIAGRIDQASSEPAGDAAAVQALLKQAAALGQASGPVADTHQNTPLAGHAGSKSAGQSALDEQRAPLAAHQNAASGMVHASWGRASEDAGARNTAPGKDRIPHSTDPLLGLAGRGGIGIVAGQHLQWASGDTLTWASGADTELATGGALRLHSQQTLSLMAGASGQGELIAHAAHGPVTLQAQNGPIELAARNDVKLASINAALTTAAAKRIHLATAGGAAITIEGGNITVQCPGTLTVHAAKKSFAESDRITARLPTMPRTSLDNIPARFDLQLKDVPGPHGVALPDTDWRIVHAPDQQHAVQSGVQILAGTSDNNGKLVLSPDEEKALHDSYNRSPSSIWIVADSHAHNLSLASVDDDWTDGQKRLHALDALGYSDEFGLVGDNPVDDFHAKLASDENKARTGAALLKTIEKTY